jgi:hypothetical protein
MNEGLPMRRKNRIAVSPAQRAARFFITSSRPTKSAVRPVGEEGGGRAVLGGQVDQELGVGPHRGDLLGVADDARVLQVGVELLLAHGGVERRIEAWNAASKPPTCCR